MSRSVVDPFATESDDFIQKFQKKKFMYWYLKYDI